MRDYVPPSGRHFDGPDCYRWRRTFAWFPVWTVSNKLVWWKTVYKQRYYTSFGPPIGQNFHMEPMVEYGDLFDVLKNYDTTH
jgi:hypothetical protein